MRPIGSGAEGAAFGVSGGQSRQAAIGGSGLSVPGRQSGATGGNAGNSGSGDRGALGQSLTGGSPLSGDNAVAAQLVQGSGGTSTETAPSGLTQAAVSRVESADGNPGELSEAEEEQVRQLRERDREVRQHEQAHARVGGQYAGPPRYEFVTGPDGRRYAVAGSVSIDVSPIPGDPEATARKAEVVRRAALAPAEPSGQDRAVAAEASELLAQARAEARAQDAAERREAITGEQQPTAEPETPTDIAEPQAAPTQQNAQNTGEEPRQSESEASPAITQGPVGVNPASPPEQSPFAAVFAQPAPEATISVEPVVPASGASVVSRRILSQLAFTNDGGLTGRPQSERPGSVLNLSV